MKNGLVLLNCIGLLACSGDPHEAGFVCDSASTLTVTLEVERPADDIPIDVDLISQTDSSVVHITTTDPVTIPAADYSVVVNRVRVESTIVGKIYRGMVQQSELICDSSHATATLNIAYAEDVSGFRVYVANNLGIVALTEDQLLADDETARTPAVTINTGLTNANVRAFDTEGYLWATDANRLIAYSPTSLATGGTAPDIVLEGDDVTGASIPGPTAVAFDSDGAMWLANISENRVVSFAGSSIRASGSPTAITHLPATSPEALAFDEDGNLWVGGETITRFNAISLQTDNATPDVEIHVETLPPTVSELNGVSTMAFDSEGNLWVGYFGANVIVRLTPSDLAANGTLAPEIQGTIPVDVLLEGMAFDDNGHLWFTASDGRIGKIDSTVLNAGGDLSAALHISIVDATTTAGLVFNPPSATLPLAF